MIPKPLELVKKKIRRGQVGRKPTGIKRRYPLPIRLTREEYLTIRRRAHAKGLKMQPYIRTMVLDPYGAA